MATYAEGKMFRGNGRWAKVMVTKLSNKTLISCAYGFEGEVKAYDVCDEFAKQKDAKLSAEYFIETGKMYY